VTAGWHSYLRQRFPGYLLPQSAREYLSVEEAQRFLSALSDQRDGLRVLRAVSLLVPRVSELAELVGRDLPLLVRGLPARTDSVQRRWEGGFHGKLHLPHTMALHLEGRRTSFVTQSRIRSFDLAENLLVRATCERLLEVLRFLRTAGALPERGWGPGLRDCEGQLHHLLSTTALRDVTVAPVTMHEENAARQARGHAYQRCADWWRWMRTALDDNASSTIARIVAEGALLPTSEAVQFELAVVIRLAEALEGALRQRDGEAWRLERALVIPDRTDMFAFLGANGKALRLYYNQSVLGPGAVEHSSKHYLPGTGRLRPDITVVFERDGRQVDAVVIECKHSADPGYVLGGFHEAVLYRHEYAEVLRGRPKAILVASSHVPGAMRAEDDVVAAGWAEWPARVLVDNLLDRLTG
jgi:hypothetical protein